MIRLYYYSHRMKRIENLINIYMIRLYYYSHRMKRNETLISKHMITASNSKSYIPPLFVSATQTSCKGSASPARTILTILCATSTTSASARKDFMTGLQATD